MLEIWDGELVLGGDVGNELVLGRALWPGNGELVLSGILMWLLLLVLAGPGPPSSPPSRPPLSRLNLLTKRQTQLK